MKEADWKKLSSLTPENLNDDDLSYLFNFFSEYDVTEQIDTENLSLLFLLALEVMKFKGEEAEVYAIDNNKLTSLLRNKDNSFNDEYRINTRETERFADGANFEDLREQLMQLESQNDHLISEMKTWELKLSQDKKEIEKLTAQVVILERENMELRREISSLHDETHERSTGSHSNSPEMSVEKQKELVNSIREKNKHISQLLNDIEVVEKENKTLREKLTSARNELSEATNQLIELTGELKSLKCSCEEKEDKLTTLEDQNLGLKNQVEELVRQKTERDSQLDDFAASIDSRIQEWKNILEKKDALIEELQSRISEIPDQESIVHSDAHDQQLKLLAQNLQRREDQIEQLQTQLQQATKEINEGATLIEKLKKQILKPSEASSVDVSTVTKMKTQLQNAGERIELLEKKLSDAEEDAKSRAEEVTDMIVLLREYEAGEYGLAEAVTEMKALRRQCRVREREAETAVQASNHLQGAVARLEEQNLALRKKLNLPPDDSMSMNDTLTQFKQEQSLVRKIQMQTERLEEEKVHLGIENRRLLKKIQELTNVVDKTDKIVDEDENDIQSPSKSSLITTNVEIVRIEGVSDENLDTQLVPVSDIRQETASVNTNRKYHEFQLLPQESEAALKERLEEFITENEALRRGMHEILDSIKNQDASSDVQINSHCLERLLEALDVRHISGWYHPAMRLQAQLQSLEGKNSVLREQLRDLRFEERQARENYEKASVRIAHLDTMLSTLQQERETVARNDNISIIPNVALSSSNSVAKLNCHLLDVLNENIKMEEINKMLENKLENLEKKYGMIRHEMGLLYKEYAIAKEEWQRQLKEATCKEEDAQSTVRLLRAQLTEAQRMEFLADFSGEEKQVVALQESVRRLLDAQTACVTAEHKCQVLQGSENFLHKRCEQMTKDMSDMECSVMKALGDYQRQKEVADYQIEALQRRLDDSLPADIFETTNNKISEVAREFKELMLTEKQNSEDPITPLLIKEIELLQSDKGKLIAELKSSLKKLHYLEEMSGHKVVMNDNNINNQISSLTEKLAAAEVNALKGNQRADNAETLFENLKREVLDKEINPTETKPTNSDPSSCAFLQIFCCGELDTFAEPGNEAELRELRNEIHQLRDQKNELQMEKQKLQEISDIAQQQVRNLELWKLTQDCQLQSLRQQMLDLLDGSDERLTIAKLSQELLTAKLNETVSIKKVQHATNELKKLQMHCLNQEMKISQERKDIINFKNKLTKRFRCAGMALHALAAQTRALAAAVARGVRERRARAGERRTLTTCVHDARCAATRAHDHADALQQQLDTLQAEGGEFAPTLDPRPEESRLTELRLKEMKLSRRLEILESQCEQSENRIVEQEEILANLEEEHMKLVNDWEQARLQWKQFKEESDELISFYKREQKILSHNAATITDLEGERLFEDMNQSATSQDDSEIIPFETENDVLKQLVLKVNTLNQQLQEKDALLSSKSYTIKELKAQITALQTVTSVTISNEVEKGKELETADKMALKATIGSLQKILIQKEDTITRYQTLLKDCQEENGRVVAQLQDQLQCLQSSLCEQYSSSTRLKNASRRKIT